MRAAHRARHHSPHVYTCMYVYTYVGRYAGIQLNSHVCMYTIRASPQDIHPTRRIACVYSKQRETHAAHRARHRSPHVYIYIYVCMYVAICACIYCMHA